MPIVPMMEAPTVSEEPLPGRPNPRIDENAPPSAFGAAVGQGIEDVGSSISAEEERLKQQNDHLRVVDANTQLEAGKNAMTYGTPDKDGKLTGGSFSLHGADAVNIPANVLPQYDALAAQISAKLTPDQQQLFKAHVSLGKAELNTSLSRYEYEESNRYAQTVFKNGLTQYAENASIGWRDPMQIAKAKLDTEGAIKIQADREGIHDQATRDSMTQTALAQLNFNVVDRMLADGNPQAALAYFVGSKGQPGIRDSRELNGEQAHQLGAQIDAALRAHQSENESSFLSRVHDIRAAATNGMMIPPASIPSDAEGAAVMGDRWPLVKKAMQGDITMGADIKRVAGLPPDQQLAILDKYKPTSVTGAAEALERQGIVQSAIAQDQARRAQDPRQYVIDNKMGSQPLNFQNMDQVGKELNQRFAATALQSNSLGGNVPPLTRDEASRFTTALTSMPDADRVRTLAQLHSTIGNDRGYQALMHQILPGSPVTAIVGTRLAQNDPTHAPAWFDGKFAQDPFDAQRILQGERLLNPQGLDKGGAEKGGKPAIKLPSDEGGAGLRASFDQKVGTLFRDRPELMEAHYATFKAAYAALSSEAGDFSPNVDSKRAKQAAQMSVGTIVTMNGGTVSAPPGMDPTKVEGAIHNALGAAAARAGLGDANWQDRLAGYLPVETGAVGSGVYKFKNGNRYLTTPDGKADMVADLNHTPARGTIHRDGDAEPVEPPAPTTGIEGAGRNAPPKPTPTETIRKPVSVRTGRGRNGAGKPSQGEPTT